MGGKGGGGGGQDWNAVAFQNASAAARRGTPMGRVMSVSPGYEDAVRAAYGANRPAPMMPSFEFPSFGGGVDYSAQMAAQQAELERQEAERRRLEGESRRDALYAQYLDAAGTSTDFINKQIGQERANARLLGIEYDVTDEQKAQRISDYFASVWGEGQQSQLEALMGEWGNPEGFEDWVITRGDASRIAGETGAQTPVDTSRGIRPTMLEEDEDTLGGGTTLLGA